MLPIRYINLDRDSLRRGQMEKALQATGLAFERFPGLLWTDLKASQQDALYSSALNRRQFYKPLVNGEKGCYASHIALWQWLAASSESGLIVLEDDVCPAGGFAEVCAAISALPSGWDMVKLIGRAELGKKEKVFSNQPLCSGFQLVEYRRVPSLTAGYALSRQGAKKLLATRLPFGRPIDVDLRHWWESQNLRVQGVIPSAIDLDESSLDSSIGQKVSERSLGVKWHKFRHKLRYSLGNALRGRRA